MPRRARDRMDLGSCPRSDSDGQTGFLVNNVHQAVEALEALVKSIATPAANGSAVFLYRNMGKRTNGSTGDLRVGREVMNTKPDLVRRYAHNPILTKRYPLPGRNGHNAAVAKHENEYIMLFRSHLRTGRSIIGWRAARRLPLHGRSEPFLTPARTALLRPTKSSASRSRVTPHGWEYLRHYSAYSRNGVRIALQDEDFSRVKDLPHHGADTGTW